MVSYIKGGMLAKDNREQHPEGLFMSNYTDATWPLYQPYCLDVLTSTPSLLPCWTPYFHGLLGPTIMSTYCHCLLIVTAFLLPGPPTA